MREDGGENPRQREQQKYSDERETVSCVRARQLGTQVKGDTGKGMKSQQRPAAAGLVCPEGDWSQQVSFKEKSEMVMILFCKEHPGSSEDRRGEMRAWETSWQVWE